MENFRGKTAVVTGGASGIGLALVQELAARGANVAVCDIKPAALDELAAQLDRAAVPALVADVDVSDRDAMFRFAERVLGRFKNVHLLFNNAGVGGEWGKFHTTSQATWPWCIDINVLGVVHGLDAFLARMVASGEVGHIVNTASIAGLVPGPGLGAYSPSKYAVVSLTEGLAIELKGTRVSASVFCPGFVDTELLDSGRSLARAPRLRTNDAELMERRRSVRQQMRESMPASTAAKKVLAAIERGDLYILSHPEFRERFEKRVAKILAAFDQVAAEAPDDAGIADVR